MPDPQIEIAKRWVTDLPFFLESLVRIRDRYGNYVPFKLNAAQRVLHERLEKQERETGKVRAIIVKGRQLGSSTYISGRFLWKIMTRSNQTAMAVAHTDDSARHIRENMYEDMFKSIPEEIRPRVWGPDTRRNFSNGSKLLNATAGGGQAGRGQTFQLLHLSEAAFYEANYKAAGAKTLSAATKAVGPGSGTEIIIETTSNGPQGVAYKIFMEEDNGYEKIFLPWFLGPEYAEEPPDGFTLDPFAPEGEMSEAEYAAEYGLSNAQMYWRRREIKQNGAYEFRHEYPATAHDAFSEGGGDTFIPTRAVMNACLEPDLLRPPVSDLPLILGVDVALSGDKLMMCWRRGPVVEGWQDLPHDPSYLLMADRIALYMKRRQPDLTIVDRVGVGAALPDLLRQRTTLPVIGAHAGGRAANSERFLNAKAEWWDRMRSWIQQENVQVFGSERDRCMLEEELLEQGYHYDINDKLVMEKKRDVKDRLHPPRSPDRAESLTLTFAAPAPRALNQLTGQPDRTSFTPDFDPLSPPEEEGRSPHVPGRFEEDILFGS